MDQKFKIEHLDVDEDCFVFVEPCTKRSRGTQTNRLAQASIRFVKPPPPPYATKSTGGNGPIRPTLLQRMNFTLIETASTNVVLAAQALSVP